MQRFRSPGGSLSAVEILTVLYFYKMKVDPNNPKDPDRDIRIVKRTCFTGPVQ